MSKVIGIDLGTTFSAVAVMEGGKPVIIANSEGKRTTPSVVGFKDNERKIGDPARRQAITNPNSTIYAIKRFMGMKFSETSDEIKRVNYKVVDGGDDTPKVDVNGTLYRPEEISSMILQKMKTTAEDYLGETVTDAVITVPAYFNDAQRQATKQAGEICGLNVKRVINEPTAAALAYGIDTANNGKDLKVCVFDCGGGTHDVSILEMSNGVFEVLSTNGDSHLGGEDFDQRIVEYICSEFANENDGFKLSDDTMALQRIKEAAEKAKIELSSQNSTEINLPYITSIEGTPKHFVITLTRAKFENLCDDLFERTIEPARNALKDANLSVGDIDQIVLVGGSTRIPKIQSLVKELFGKEPNKGVNPDEVVALGAAIQGGVITGEVNDVLLLDVTPLNLNITTMGDVATSIIDANTTIPTTKSQIFSTAVDNQPGVEIEVTQGNRPMAKDNKRIGIFHLDGIAPAKRGVPQIEITFDIDANGIINVKAVDKATNKEQSIRIEAGSSISKEEIEKMKADAEKFADEDKKKREDVDKINSADSFVFSVEKGLDTLGDKVSEDEKKEVSELLDKLKGAISSKNIEDIDKYKKETEDKWYPIAEKAYKGDATSSGNTMNSPFGDANNPFGANGPFANCNTNTESK